MNRAECIIDMFEPTDEGIRDAIRKGKKFVDWAVKKVELAKRGLEVEKQETKTMMKTFFKLLERKLSGSGSKDPTEVKVRAAIAQLKDVAKVALVATVLLGPIPGDEPLLFGLELLARKFGLSLFPSALQGIV